MSTTIESSITLLNEVSHKVEQHFRTLSETQLNWKADAGKWSIAQCLDHIIRTNEGYLEQFDLISAGQKQNSLWERMPLLPTLLGNLLLKASDPDNQKQLPAPKDFRPSSSNFPLEVLDNFLAHNRMAVRSIERLPTEKLKRWRLTSPVSPFFTMRLDQAVELIAIHEQRHLQQALRVMEAAVFPAE